ncbi:MAG TPA: PepSY-associated TM helix domain-containing protein [Terracidiphilus sp.]
MKAVRAIIFWLHLATGCVAGLVILAMSITGVLLAFERQINGWADAPAVLEGHADTAPQAPLDSLLADLKSNGRGIPSELVLHNSANYPVEVRFGRERTLYLNPWTGEMIGQPSEATRAFFGTVERVHRSLGLGMQSAFGRGITGAANLAFLFMLLSGIYLWIPKVLNLTSLTRRLLFRRGLEGRAREWNWHNVIGIWTVIPLFFIVLTGVIMSYPWASNLLYRVTGTQPPANGWRGERGAHANGPSHAPSDPEKPAAALNYRTLDDLAQIAKQQVPAWKTITIAVPAVQDRTLDVSIDKSIGGQPEQASQLVINRQSGHVEAIKRFSDNNAGRKLRAWARFLHTGEEFGVAGELIAAIACIGAVMLVWTGLSMALRRLLAAQKSQRAPADLPVIQTGADAPVSMAQDAIPS